MISKDRWALLFSVIFAPLLALLVSLAIFFRPDRLEEIDTRLRLVRLGVGELVELEGAGRRALNSPVASLEESWERQYRALGRVLATQAAERDVEKSIVEVMSARYAAISPTFAELVEWHRSSPSQRDPTRGIHLEEELFRHYRELYNGLISLIEIDQHDLSVNQQNLDAVLILFAALMALVLAGLAYIGIRSELNRRSQMAHELEQSNILLSDAFVRLRRAEQGFQQDRLQLLRKMIQGVIQEARAHLQPVTRVAETLLDYTNRPLDPVRVRQALENLLQSARAARATLDRFAQVTETPAAAMVPQSVDLNRAVEEAFATQQAALESAQRRGAAIRVEKKLGALSRIDGAEGDWRESLAHLIQNAIEAMPQGGSLTVETFEEGDRVGFRVSDTGKGMDEAVRRHCCEPCFSTKEQEASGLGLTWMAGTVRRHNGSVEIDSRPGLGTRITVRLPRVQAVDPVAAETDAAGAGHEVTPRRILLVDDEPWVRDTLRDILTAEGHQVTPAAHGNQAVELCRQQGFDLVITDRAMPGMDGERLAMEIKRIRPRIAVILLTGLGDIIRNAGVTSQYVDVIVSKPVTPDQLRKAMGDALKSAGAARK